MANKDTIYSGSYGQVTPFEFNNTVADVFADMIQRSVPGYQNCIAMLTVIARQYAQSNTNLYDLGCSLGAGLIALQSGLQHDNCHLIGIDNSLSMLNRCHKILSEQMQNNRYELRHEPIQKSCIKNASIIAMNFTLQFLPREDRQPMLDRLYKGLLPGGVLIVSEKFHAEAQQQQLWQTLHEQFKRMQGYNEMEISAKRAALENVLIPETKEVHKQRLLQAGFNRADCWYQCFNFCSFLAVK